MKPTPHGLRRSAFLIFPLLVLPLIISAPSGATTNAPPQTPATTTTTAQASPNDSGTLKFAVTVIGAKGGFLAGLTKEEFSVWEGKTEREINYFSSDELPASIAVLIDGSGSMQPRGLSAARYGAARFLAQSNPANEYLVGEFNQVWRGLIGWMQGPQALGEVSDNLMAEATITRQSKSKGYGPTALYDACDSALDALAARAAPRRILLLITDGQDNQSRIKFTQLRKKVQASDVQIYGIGITDRSYPDSLNVAGQAILVELSAVSGGRAYFPENKDRKEMDEVVDRIAAHLRYQYVIGFKPTNAAAAGKWNKVKIKVTPRDTKLKSLLVLSREGYFSPSATPAP
ncbi:MAG TPA: VWA domain-containing protein [Pyrinomonadaceae bacterium]|jgi:Ca-activated chloride channel family protein